MPKDNQLDFSFTIHIEFEGPCIQIMINACTVLFFLKYFCWFYCNSYRH